MGITDLDNRFTYHAPKYDPDKGDQAARYVVIRDEAHTYALRINTLCPDSREKSLAITKLEEVVFWANAAIARNE